MDCDRRENLKKVIEDTRPTTSRFTFCEVGHNAPAFMNSGDKLAWYAKIYDGKAEVGACELAEEECDFRVQGDYAIISKIRTLN